MLIIVFSLIFVAETKIICVYNFVVPLSEQNYFFVHTSRFNSTNFTIAINKMVV